MFFFQNGKMGLRTINYVYIEKYLTQFSFWLYLSNNLFWSFSPSPFRSPNFSTSAFVFSKFFSLVNGFTTRRYCCNVSCKLGRGSLGKTTTRSCEKIPCYKVFEIAALLDMLQSGFGFYELMFCYKFWQIQSVIQASFYRAHIHTDQRIFHFCFC